MMRLFLVFIFLSLFFNLFSQYKLSNIPYKLENINQSDSKGKQGIWFFYDRFDSSIFAMENFANDTLHGYFERYWPSGIVSERGYYNKGKSDSAFIAFWQNGKERAIASYNEGILHGVSISFDINGRVISKEKYINGKIDSTYELSYWDRTVSRERNNYKIDTIKTFYNSEWNKKYAIYKNDTLIEEIDFFKNKIRIKSFYENQTLKKRILFYKSNLEKVEKIYNYKDNVLSEIQCYNKNNELVPCR